MQGWQISSLQAGWLVAGIVSLTGHALAVSYFIKAGGRDSWMSGILGFPMAAVSVWSWVMLSRRFPGKTLIEYLPKVLGYPGYLLSAVYVLYYFTVVVFTIRVTTDWMVDTILFETPSWVMAALYVGAVLYAAGNLDVLARINQFTLPLLTVLGLLVSFGTMQAKDYSLLTPFFEYGWGPVLAVTGLGLGYYGETSVLAMFTAFVRPGDRKFLLRSYILALLFVVTTLTGPLAGSIATLGYRLALNMEYPTFQHWLMVSLARFFERTDLLAVHQWLAGAYPRCGVYLLMTALGLQQMTGSQSKLKPWILPVLGGLVVLASELLFPTKPAFNNFAQYIYLPAGAILGIAAPPVLLAIAWVRGLAAGRGDQSHGA